MEFTNIRKWMQKMHTILDLYGQEESFTQSEKNLLLDYNQKIKDAISQIVVNDQDDPEDIIRPVQTIRKEEPIEDKITENSKVPPSNHVSENNAIPRSGSHKYHELFQFKKVEDLSEKLESSPIDNIHKALGLNERILTQNELFKGDKNSFDSAVQKLNEMNHFDEARNYLCEEIIPAYDWSHEDRIKKAQEFIKLVKRKYS